MSLDELKLTHRNRVLHLGGVRSPQPRVQRLRGHLSVVAAAQAAEAAEEAGGAGERGAVSLRFRKSAQSAPRRRTCLTKSTSVEVEEEPPERIITDQMRALAQAVSVFRGVLLEIAAATFHFESSFMYVLGTERVARQPGQLQDAQSHQGVLAARSCAFSHTHTYFIDRCLQPERLRDGRDVLAK